MSHPEPVNPDCAEIGRLLPAFADGEIDGPERTEIELHLTRCEACRELVSSQTAFRSVVRERVQVAVAPERLRMRIRQDIARERLVGQARRFATYSAVAAGVVAVASAGYIAALPEPDTAEDLMEDAIEKHARALPVEVTPAGGDVDGWFRGKVDFNVTAPRFRSPNAPRLVGARLANVRERQAAMIEYGGETARRTTLLVFPVGEEAELAEPGSPEVLLANRRGYNVALWKRSGIVYSLVSDMDESDVRQLISEVVPAVDAR